MRRHHTITLIFIYFRFLQFCRSSSFRSLPFYQFWPHFFHFKYSTHYIYNTLLQYSFDLFTFHQQFFDIFQISVCMCAAGAGADSNATHQKKAPLFRIKCVVGSPLMEHLLICFCRFGFFSILFIDRRIRMLHLLSTLKVNHHMYRFNTIFLCAGL